MKFFTVLLVSFFVAFVLSSCSNVEQDYSPVSPEINKVTVQNTDGAFRYLQTFQQVGVESFGPSIGAATDEGLVVTCQSKYWPAYVQAALVVLEHSSLLQPVQDEFVIVNKPKSNVLVLPGYSVQNLTNVKVYYYTIDFGTVPNGLPDFTPVNKMKVASWNTTGNSIEVLSNDWTTALTDCFIEVQMKSKNLMVYIAKPQNKQIVLPMFGNMGVLDVNLYGLFQQ
jgi:hypothetical protein